MSSGYVDNAVTVNAFSISFSSNVVVSNVSLYNAGFGYAPSYWTLRVGGFDGTIVASGGVSGQSGSGTSVGLSLGYGLSGAYWNNANTSIATQTYYLTAQHTAGGTTNIGISRMYFKVKNEQPGYIYPPTLPSITDGVGVTVYPYIKA